MTKKIIVIGGSSDIGSALIDDAINKGWDIKATFRTRSEKIDAAIKRGVGTFIDCDLSNITSVDNAASKLIDGGQCWDVLVLGPGLQDPVGLFEYCNFDEWANSVNINFTNQIRFIHRLLPARDLSHSTPPTVLLFAGGGTNNAPTHYSAYIASKIGLMKMTELLSVEIPDTKFVILGPGWVKTKIHKSTFDAKDRAGVNYKRTLQKFNDDDFVPMQRVVECCNWIFEAEKNLVSGRNFSLVFDKWGSTELNQKLKDDIDMYKLRRSGN